MNKYNEAIADCNSAIDLDETYLKAYLRRAKTNMDLENFEEAVRDYEKIVKMDKSSRGIFLNLFSPITMLIHFI
jgi:DnaJ family protein C protein 7